jgi:dipeptidase E
MKLVLYSGGDNIINESIDNELLKLLPSKDVKFCFIPSKSDGSEEYFQDVIKYYSKYGLSKFSSFFADVPNPKDKIKKLLNNDIIYLSGGNTYYFLYYLKKYNLLNVLIEFVKKGGIIIGVSAGSIIQTPNIQTSGIPYFDCDENIVGLTDFTALNLVNFEFYPHYVFDLQTDEELLKYSENNGNEIYACSDGSGIVINGKELKFVGKIYKFFQGMKSNI